MGIKLGYQGVNNSIPLNEYIMISHIATYIVLSFAFFLIITTILVRLCSPSEGIAMHICYHCYTRHLSRLLIIIIIIIIDKFFCNSTELDSHTSI